MTLPLAIHPRADLDQMECFSFLARHSPAAARRFLDAVESALSSIAANPAAGHRYLHARRPDEDWRYIHVPGFRKYLVFYRLAAVQTEVVRIVHGSRDLDSIFSVL
jgi:toxin ParE1/3/4